MTVRVYLELECSKEDAKRILENKHISSRQLFLEHKAWVKETFPNNDPNNIDFATNDTVFVSEYIFLGEEHESFSRFDDGD